MILALDHFKAEATTNSNSVSNAWNFLFMTVSKLELYHLKLIVQFEGWIFYPYKYLSF